MKGLEELKNSMETIRSTASEIIKGVDKKIYISKQEEKIENLAKDIVEFVKEYDHCVNCEDEIDREKQLKDVKADIKSGNTEYLEKWFKTIINEKEPADLYDKANELVGRVSVYTKDNNKERVTEKSTSKEKKTEKHEKEKMENHYHRSH